MFTTITYIKLRTPLHYFILVFNAMKISIQLSGTNCTGYKFHGFWTKHYTMTSWNSKEDMKAFARSGAHLKAMKKSAFISKEIRILTIEAPAMPKWREAKEMLFKEGRILNF